MRTVSIFTAVILLHLCSLKTFAQACPACSNPALQSSEKLEAGLDTLKKGLLRFTLNVNNGFNYQGGHPNNSGLSPEGEVIGVPLHNHIVELDFIRMEPALEYTFRTNWTLWLRVPIDIKIQTATVEFTEPVTQYEKETILRNRDIHHRTEKYAGISDLRLLAAHRLNGFLFPGGRLDLALGTSLPVGKTEENPLEAGDQGLRHLHIQFGTGTFDPLFEFHFTAGLSPHSSLALYSINKVSLYENRKNYQGPFESTNGLSFSYQAAGWLTPRVTLANFTQGWAHWDEEKDPNSGLIAYNLTANLTLKLKNGLVITPGYRHPITQQTLSDHGDTFEFGPTFLLNVSHKFND